MAIPWLKKSTKFRHGRHVSHMRDNDPGLPDLLNWAAIVADGVVLCKDGSLLAGWVYQGHDLDSSPDSRLNWTSDRVNAALAPLGGGWAIWVDAVRMPSPKYLDQASQFPDPTSAKIDAERRVHFTTPGRHYETEYALLVHYTPPARVKGMLVDLIYDGEAEADQSPANALLMGFERTLAEIEDALSGAIRLRRMREFEAIDPTGKPQRRSHLINYLHFTVTGQEVSLNLPRCGFYLDTVIGGQECFPGDTPMIGSSYVAVVAVMGFPAASVPGLMSVLELIAVPMRFSSRFICIDQPEAKRQIAAIERKWKQRVLGFWSAVLRMPAPRLDQDAVDMTTEAGSAMARTSSALVGTGYYTPVVVLTAASPAEATENARLVSRELMRLGFATRIETTNAMEALLGSFPGHAVPNVRRPLIHTDNLADLLPLTAVWTGEQTNPCPFYPDGSPALLQAATGGAPFFLNVYSGDVGHTLIFGPIGSGKSTLLATVAVQALRYPDMTIWWFDKGLSALASTKACRGQHYDIAPDGDLSFCPLSVLDTDADAAWAEEWFAVCFELQHGKAPEPAERDDIHQAISRIRTSAAGRSLTHFAAEVQSNRVREAVNHYTISGPLGRLLDSESDGLADGRLMTFETEELMGMGDKQSIPVLLYLFRRFEKSLRGQPAMLLLDEAWILLGHDVFREKIREWLKVLRKANCAVILATQSLSDASRSGIQDVLIESCPTKIFLANADAATVGTPEHPGPSAHYQAFGLNETQIATIQAATPKRHYYVVSPSGCRLFDLQLGPVALSFVGAGSKQDIARVNALAAEHGDDWPDVWLAERGVVAA